MANTKANLLPKLRVAMILPGLGRVQRGAETAFLELARAFQTHPDLEVTLFGSGTETPPGVRVHTVPCWPRESFEKWPQVPVLRNEYCYEEMSFILSLILRRSFRPRDFDVVLHCTFPFTNWFVQSQRRNRGPRSVFVTQNGDWMCRANSREFRSFSCDGLICTNPEIYERHQHTYRAGLIPNGVDPQVFHPGSVSPRDPRFPLDRKVILMASAFIASKKVADGIRSVAAVPDAFLALVGDGPDREELRGLASQLLPGRHAFLGSVPRTAMPDLFRQADAFLHMSQDEPFGIVYLEAAASGLPIVAHDAPVPRWILGEQAWYANTSHPQEVAHALHQALKTELGRPRGAAARTHVLNGWTWSAQAQKYRDFLFSLVPPRSSSSEVVCSRSSWSASTPATCSAAV